MIVEWQVNNSLPDVFITRVVGMVIAGLKPAASFGYKL